jgi:PelA/Pel-15E family pectate lyase
MKFSVRFPLTALLILSFAAASTSRAVFAIGWARAQRADPDWFRSAEGKQVVANVLAMQFPCGGWDKNLERAMDLAKPLSEADRSKFARRADRGTIDNGATYSQLRFLAHAYSATHDEAVREAFYQGIDYLLAAQYENGGWPMYFPLRKGYYTHIHFNDNSVAGVLNLMQDIAEHRSPFDFVDETRHQRAANAVAKGIDCILNCQVVVAGKRTAWCAQHDEVTLKPAAARAFEPVSLSGQESVGLVRFLMRVEKPSPKIVEAVQSALQWLDAVKIKGIRVVRVQTAEGSDSAVQEDPEAPPLWARLRDRHEPAHLHRS